MATAGLFLQAVPDGVEVSEVERRLIILSPVTSTHHGHVWSPDGEHHVLGTHIGVQEVATQDEVLGTK
jgi:Co/Zn/Cd efflux system component